MSSDGDDWSRSFSQWIDEQQRLIRTSSWLLPGVGLALLAFNRGAFRRHRSWTAEAASKPFTAFSAEIAFNKTAVQIYLHHSSAIQRILALSPSKISPKDTLPSKLAAIQLDNSFVARSLARDLLWRRNLEIQVVNSNDDTFSLPPSVIAYRGIGGFRWDVGKELIRKGAAMVDPLVKVDTIPSPIIEEYRRVEDWAKIRGRGMWRKRSKVVRVNALCSALSRFWHRQRGSYDGNH